MDFCYIVGLIAYLPEGFLAAMLEDNRLLRRAQELEAALHEDLVFYEELSVSFWQVLAGHVSLEPAALRHHVLWGSHVALGYLDLKVFSTIAELPWCLVRGQIGQNLAALQESSSVPEDSFTRKVWALLKAGYPFLEIEQALHLWSASSFSSHLTETLHASAALVRRHHPEYSPERLVGRAFAHTLRSA